MRRLAGQTEIPPFAAAQAGLAIATELLCVMAGSDRHVALCLVAFVLICCVPGALAQIAAPNEWRSVSYADLQLPGPTTTSFAALWADEITRNNAAYRKRGDRRFLAGNAPATESHFVIRSPVKTVVLSVLNTATACGHIATDGVGRATLKRCPMRLAVYQANRSAILNAGTGCFIEYAALETGSSRDPARNASYAAYDKDTRTIRTGLFFAGQPADDCITRIPLPQG
jgi:hypothetical protein